MTTNAQMKANRKNAKKSTGPRTEDGKARSAQNSLKHGLLARDTVMPGEDPSDFDSQLSALEADIRPVNSLEFELVRQIADAQWRMRRLTRLETGFLAAAVDDQRRHLEKRRPDELRPGYDGETLLLGSAMLDRTQAFVHLARYDGHLSRRFFRAVKQLADLRDAQHRRDTSARPENSHTCVDSDPYHGRYVPAQAPPPIDAPSPTAERIGFRASSESPPLRSRAREQAVSFKSPATNRTDQTNPISPKPNEINRRPSIEQRQSRGRQPAGQRPRNTARVRTATTVARRSVVQRHLARGVPCLTNHDQPNDPNSAELQWNQRLLSKTSG